METTENLEMLNCFIIFNWKEKKMTFLKPHILCWFFLNQDKTLVSGWLDMKFPKPPDLTGVTIQVPPVIMLTNRPGCLWSTIVLRLHLARWETRMHHGWCNLEKALAFKFIQHYLLSIDQIQFPEIYTSVHSFYPYICVWQISAIILFFLSGETDKLGCIPS